MLSKEHLIRTLRSMSRICCRCDVRIKNNKNKIINKNIKELFEVRFPQPKMRGISNWNVLQQRIQILPAQHPTTHESQDSHINITQQRSTCNAIQQRCGLRWQRWGNWLGTMLQTKIWNNFWWLQRVTWRLQLISLYFFGFMLRVGIACVCVTCATWLCACVRIAWVLNYACARHGVYACHASCASRGMYVLRAVHVVRMRAQIFCSFLLCT